MAMIGQSNDAVHEAGAQTDAGSFICLVCDFPLSLDHPDAIPACPNCGGERFKRASLFEQPTVTNPVIGAPPDAPQGWLQKARASISEPGSFVALHADGRAHMFELAQGWSRVGRSASADIRLDDPTVSRRHAVIVRTAEGELRVLDDRSMNGIAVNGEGIDWSSLADGDELQVGRYTLHVIEREPGSEQA